MTIAATDGGPAARAAADWAADRAVRAGAPVTLVRVVEPHRGDDHDDVERRIREGRIPADDEASRLRTARPTLEVVVEVVYGDPGEVLRAATSPTTLLVLGNPARDAHRAGSVVDRVVATASGPVALIPVDDTSADTRREGIVVGVDGTDASLSALEFAADEAARWGEPLEAVHAWLDLFIPPQMGFLAASVVPRTGSSAPPEVDSEPGLLRMQHQALLHEAVATLTATHPGLTVHERATQGDATRILLDASRSRRLLVVGDHGRRRIARFLLGSVSHAAVLAVAGPTVVVRPAEHRQVS